MAEYNSHETLNIYPSLNAVSLNDQQFRLNKISEVRYLLIDEIIKERELMSKRLRKCIASFDCFDKPLIASSVTTGSISTASFATIIGVPVGIASASFSLAFLISAGIVDRFLKTTWNKKKKHNKTVILAISKLNSIESKKSEGLINNEISHEDFLTIINEERSYWELEKSIRMMNS